MTETRRDAGSAVPRQRRGGVLNDVAFMEPLAPEEAPVPSVGRASVLTAITAITPPEGMPIVSSAIQALTPPEGTPVVPAIGFPVSPEGLADLPETTVRVLGPAELRATAPRSAPAPMPEAKAEVRPAGPGVPG